METLTGPELSLALDRLRSLSREAWSISKALASADTADKRHALRIRLVDLHLQLDPAILTMERLS